MMSCHVISHPYCESCPCTPSFLCDKASSDHPWSFYSSLLLQPHLPLRPTWHPLLQHQNLPTLSSVFHRVFHVYCPPPNLELLSFINLEYLHIFLKTQFQPPSRSLFSVPYVDLNIHCSNTVQAITSTRV